MTARVNFLPWRQARRQRQWRRRLLLAIGGGAIVLLVLLNDAATQRRERAIAAIDAAARRQTSAALALRERQLRQQLQRGERAQARRQRLAATLAWRERLLALAAALPDDAWLTQLHYQQRQLILEGGALTSAALTAADKALKSLPGLTPGAAGETRRDADGLWRFSYRFSLQDGDVPPA